MSSPVFFSLFAYAAQKVAEVVQRTAWADVLREWDAAPELSPWIGFRTLATAKRAFEGSIVSAVGAGSLITKGRSRMAGVFLRSEADVWLTCDDDVEAGEDVLRSLVSAARQTRGIVSAPCVLRGYKEGDVRLNLGLDLERAREGLPLAPLTRTGLGLVAMHRDAIVACCEGVPLVTGGTQGEEPFPALFLETVYYPPESPYNVGEWVGEDFRFSDVARERGITLYALTNAPVNHAGVWGMLRPDLAVLVKDGEGRFTRF